MDHKKPREIATTGVLWRTEMDVAVVAQCGAKIHLVHGVGTQPAWTAFRCTPRDRSGRGEISALVTGAGAGATHVLSVLCAVVLVLRKRGKK